MNLRFCATMLLWLAFGLFAPGQAEAQCEGNAWGWCEDCTSPTPCCGYGPCNVFCGNCDGGCRRADTPSGVSGNPMCIKSDGDTVAKAIRATHPIFPESSDPKAWRAKFDAIDKNHNSTISFAETRAWALQAKKGMTRQQLREGFDKADANGNGKIEPVELDRSLGDAPAAATGTAH
ncbi:MAG TPA: EF-hand domain-containing protein [Tahibacter sp.]|nr:EF-hand domain-containing protein [Tahibacter sp.]